MTDRRRVIKNPNDRPLPPPGDARREELSRRTDELEEMAEELSENVGTIDPRVLEPDPAIMGQFNMLDVSNADPAYRYCWVYTGQLGSMVKMKLVEGWEVVQGDMQEAKELTQGDGTRRLADVLLMRIRLDRAIMLDRQDRERRERQQQAVTAQLEEAGARYAKEGVIVSTPTNMSPERLKTMETRAGARRTAMGAVDNMLREGTVPGVPSPGRGRR